MIRILCCFRKVQHSLVMVFYYVTYRIISVMEQRERTLEQYYHALTIGPHFMWFQQVAQLSQRDRAAGWVSYGQKWKTGTGRKYLRTI